METRHAEHQTPVVFHAPLETFDLAVVIGLASRNPESMSPGKAEAIARVRQKLVDVELLSPIDA